MAEQKNSVESHVSPTEGAGPENLVKSLSDRSVGLAVQVAAAKSLVRNHAEFLGNLVVRTILEDLPRRCVEAWQISPTWEHRELLAEVQTLLKADGCPVGAEGRA